MNSITIGCAARTTPTSQKHISGDTEDWLATNPHCDLETLPCVAVCLKTVYMPTTKSLVLLAQRIHEVWVL